MKTNKVYYGDAMELSKELQPNSINLVITSPPYANTKSYGEGINIFFPSIYAEWFLPLAKQVERALTPDGSFILNIGDICEKGTRSIYVYDLVCRIVRETQLKLHDRYFWIKKNGLPSSGPQRLDNKTEMIFHFKKNHQIKCFMDEIREPHAPSSLARWETPCGSTPVVDKEGNQFVKKRKHKANPKGKIPDGNFDFSNAASQRKDRVAKHPAAFHPDVPHKFINWLTEEGDVVLDPFMGSGTTKKVCEKLNRKWIGFELNENYKDLIDGTI